MADPADSVSCILEAKYSGMGCFLNGFQGNFVERIQPPSIVKIPIVMVSDRQYPITNNSIMVVMKTGYRRQIPRYLRHYFREFITWTEVPGCLYQLRGCSLCQMGRKRLLLNVNGNVRTMRKWPGVMNSIQQTVIMPLTDPPG